MKHPNVLFPSFLTGLLSIKNAGAAYCNRNGCDGRPQGCCDNGALTNCNSNKGQCETSGLCGDGPQWCENSFSYCTWSTCDGVIRSTEYCNESKGRCEGDCSGTWCTNGGESNSGSLPSDTTALSTATSLAGDGTATTTRYWDCSGGACGCGYGDRGKPAHCYSNAMFTAPANNPHGASFYGTAAVSRVLFGSGDWRGSGCGTCYKLTGISNTGQVGVETTIVLKAANLCPEGNSACSGDKVHFDIAAPGFDFLASSLSNTCNDGREPIEQDAFGACQGWPGSSCDCSAFQDEVLRAGCNNFMSLNWNNPTVSYQAVACPAELDRLNCWEENGGSWPFNPPEFCASNFGEGGGGLSAPSEPTPSPPVASPSADGTATTTRYWDCSGGACGCGYGDSGKPAHCYSNAMFIAPANNPFGASFYGTAAVSRVLFGPGDWLGSGCGTCYKLTGTSNTGQVGVETTIILKAANLCPEGNSACSGDKVHFDIAAPGFDFLASSLSNTCNDGREPIEQDAFGACQGWPGSSCDCSAFQDEVLEAGCNNFMSLNWNNPTVSYQAVACPAELDRLNCWDANGGSWPFNPPEFCANNVGDSSAAVTTHKLKRLFLVASILILLYFVGTAAHNNGNVSAKRQ